MAYVISHCQNGGYVRLKSGKGGWATLLKNATKFQTLDNATNFIDNNFSGIYPTANVSDIKILNMENLAEEYCADGTQFTEETAKQVLEDMIAFYDQIVENTDKFCFLPGYFGGIVKQCDLETLDILHKVEFTNENVVNGFKRYKQMQEVRQRRRVAKDSLEFASLIISSGLLSCLKKLKTDIAELKEFGETREYRPRILTSMFDEVEEEE